MFKRPNQDKITEFLNESDEQLAYRLQNEEFFQQNSKNSRRKSSSTPDILPKNKSKSPNQGTNSSSNASQEEADFLFAQKLQREEEERYQRHLENQKRKNEQNRQQSQKPEQNPLFSHVAAKNSNNNNNRMGFDKHGPSTSTKIPGKEAQKSHQIQDAYIANKLNQQINRTVKQERAIIKNPTPPTPVVPAPLISNRSTEKRPLDLPIIPSISPEFNTPNIRHQQGESSKINVEVENKQSEDELLALKLHRQELIEANKHIKSDKQQLIERIREDRINERNRRKNNMEQGIPEPCASPTAVSPVEDKNFRFPKNNDGPKKSSKGQIIKYT